MPSGQETDWAYSMTAVPGTHTGLSSTLNLNNYSNNRALPFCTSQFINRIICDHARLPLHYNIALVT